MDDRVKYWEGKAVFTPTKALIDVFVDGSENDNMLQQHEFFRRLSHDWSNISAIIDRFLVERLHDREPSTFVESAWSWFRISSLRIPNASLDRALWEISLTEISDPTRLWTVQMRGLSADQFTIDD
jgi:hypothetical protein